MDRCPCCHARLRERVVCSRCQADLSALIHAEQGAEWWLGKAIHSWCEGEIEQSIKALGVSLSLKRTYVALVFRGVVIEKICQNILNLLAQKQLLCAKQQIYDVRLLFPYSQQLQQLNAFTDYLLVKTPDNALGS